MSSAGPVKRGRGGPEGGQGKRGRSDAAASAASAAADDADSGAGAGAGASTGMAAHKGLKVISWNVNGLRALLKKDTLAPFIAKEKPDVLLLNETKLNDEHLEQHAAVLPGYTAHWATATVKKGYSGVAAFTRDGLGVTSVTRGIGIPKHDAEGRVVTVELPQAFVTGTYTPNSGMKLERLDYRTNDWDPAFLAYIKGLKARKPVILAGDLNVAHEEIDIHNPKGNANKTPGFCDGERENFTALLKEGFVDAWRAANPGVPQFSYWSYRFNAKAQNKGWRLDYTVVSDDIASKVTDTFVRADVVGSDHVPVGIVVDI